MADRGARIAPCAPAVSRNHHLLIPPKAQDASCGSLKSWRMNAGYWRRYLRRASPISSFVDCQQPVLSPPVSARGFAVRTSRALYRWPTPSGQRKTRSMVAHGALIFSSFSAGKHLSVPCGVTNYENLFVACNCDTRGASAKRGRLASPISSRAKFFRRGAARPRG